VEAITLRSREMITKSKEWDAYRHFNKIEPNRIIIHACTMQTKSSEDEKT